MPYVFFHNHFPDIADKETRTVTVLNNSEWNLPPAHYSLLEMYCNDPGCDCRRVFFCVVSSLTKGVEAVIAYGWESPKFYAKWMGGDNPDVIKNLKGPVLNVGSPQSNLAPSILRLVEDVILQNQAYVERIKIHYRMFRHNIDTRSKQNKLKKNKRKA